jgi:hypothetical protein
MKNTILSFLILLFILSCETGTQNSELKDEVLDISEYGYDTITFDTIDITEFNLSFKECVVAGSTGGPVIYTLFLVFEDTSMETLNTITFGVEEKNNNEANLLDSGKHFATGRFNDNIDCKMIDKVVYMNYLASDELVIYLNSNFKSIYDYEGSGYIEILKEVKWEWPEKIWIGDKYIYPGDPEYLDHCTPYIIKPSKLFFSTD